MQNLELVAANLTEDNSFDTACEGISNARDTMIVL